MTAAKVAATIESETVGEVALIRIVGFVDETFTGFSALPSNAKALVIDLAAMTRMTSFGVRQWIKALDALPRTVEIYLLGAPTFFVDQLNMVLNFCGPAKVLTVDAPFSCPSCANESSEVIDVLAHRAGLVRGDVPTVECTRCGAQLEFNEMPDSYFLFVTKHGASSVHPEVARLLTARGRLYGAVETSKPPRVTKLVHGLVTYFRISGAISSVFRARPLVAGTEGNVVIDLAEITRFEPSGYKEWARLLKDLSSTVTSVTLVDATEEVLAVASDTFNLAPNISVSSICLPYTCQECGKVAHHSVTVEAGTPPPAQQVCTACGGAATCAITAGVHAMLRNANLVVPAVSAQLIARRDEILSRARTDAKVAGAREQSAKDVPDGAILGKYKIVRRLSAGGMAEVFVANQTGLGGFEKLVAVKRIQHQLLENRHLAIDLFLNEAKIAGRLMHPNIVQVLDVGEVDGALYLAMEYVHGKDLRDVAKRLAQAKARMAIGDACFIITEVANALHYAYWSTDHNGNQMSVVHRDVSPHNVILSFDGNVKLLDFGVAMSSVTDHSERMIAGKWMYMSPEALQNADIDHRSDLFSLGVMLYLLCSGAMPFAGKTNQELLTKIRNRDYKRLESPEVPERLVALVDRMLAPHRDDRFQTGQAVAAELNEIMRTSGLVGSVASVKKLVRDLFAEETNANEFELSVVTDESRHTVKMAVGSGTAQAQPRPTATGMAAQASVPPPKPQTGEPTVAHEAPGLDVSTDAKTTLDEPGKYNWSPPSAQTPAAPAAPAAPARTSAPLPVPPRVSTPMPVPARTSAPMAVPARVSAPMAAPIPQSGPMPAPVSAPMPVPVPAPVPAPPASTQLTGARNRNAMIVVALAVIAIIVIALIAR